MSASAGPSVWLKVVPEIVPLSLRYCTNSGLIHYHWLTRIYYNFACFATFFGQKQHPRTWPNCCRLLFSRFSCSIKSLMCLSALAFGLPEPHQFSAGRVLEAFPDPPCYGQAWTKGGAARLSTFWKGPPWIPFSSLVAESICLTFYEL